MKKISWLGIVVCMLLITAGSLLWAWLGKDFSLAAISRGFFVGAPLALIMGLANLQMGRGFVQQDMPSYSTAYYNTLQQRKRLMFADMSQGASWTSSLLISGGISLLLGILLRSL